MAIISFRNLAIELLIMTIIGLLLALLGPFGSYAYPLGWRLLYWVGFIIIGYAIFRPVGVVALWLSEESRLPYPAAMILASLVSAIPLTWMIGFAIGGMQYDPRILEDGFALLYAQCAGIGIAIFALMVALFGKPDRRFKEPVGQESFPAVKPESAELVATSETVKSRLHDRLPAGFPEIVALGVEDHYVRVHAGERSEMLLMRLSDAMAEMEPVDGLQVHRSWWVASRAVRRGVRDGRNVKLLLDSGLEVPVSRPNVAKVKQAGWIA